MISSGNVVVLPHSATQLWQVERDGNPLRRYGQVSPFIGKLGPLNSAALDQIAQLARAALPVLPEPTLVIGMTESSLLLAYFMALWQQKPVDLRFTSRKKRAGGDRRAFREPHSHGPQHFLDLEAGKTYAQIIVIEDELTTGATLHNLICAADVAPRVFVLTLRDLRPQQLRDNLQNEMKNLGIELQVVNLGDVVWAEDASVEKSPPNFQVDFNPFGRHENHRREAAQKLQQLYAQHAPDALYIVGECVDIALQFWLQLPAEKRPELRHITRSPWKVDGETIHSAQLFPGDGSGSRYFFYNFAPPQNSRALWIAEASNAVVGAQVGEFLQAQDVESWGVEVAGG